MKKNDGRLIPMTYDVVFKSVLQDKESEGYLVDLISGITSIKKELIKGNIVFKNTELVKDEIVEKGKATDLIIELKNNIINLEMNKRYYDGLIEKNDRYIDKIKDGTILSGEKYGKMEKKIIQVNFDNFELFDERIVIKFRMMDAERGIIRSDFAYNNDVEIYHINLKRLKEMYYNKSKLSKFEKELLLMTIDNEKELTKITSGYEEMEKVAKKISKISREEELQGIYDIEEQEEFIRDRIRYYAARKGYEEGMEKGLKDGMEKGMEKGITGIVINMLNDKIDIKTISKLTGLTEKKINDLKKQV